MRFLSDTRQNIDTIKNLTPDYYLAMAFYGSEWCYGTSASNPPGCAQFNWGGRAGYNEYIPTLIENVLEIIGKEHSKKFVLGIHARGIDENTVAFWCKQVKSNKLGGIFITFIEEIDPERFNQLHTCMKGS